MSRSASSPDAPVFFDPSGRRRRVINRASLAAGVTTGIVGVLFIFSLLAAPFVGGPSAIDPVRRLERPASALLAPHRTRVSRHLIERERAALSREISATRGTNRGAPVAQVSGKDSIVAAFYVVWRQNGYTDLQANASKLTHLMPEWLHLSRDGGGLDTTDWNPLVTPRNTEVIALARAHNLDIVPVFNNAEARQFDPERARRLLESPAKRREVARAVRDFLVRNDFDGINLDFEALRPQDYRLLPIFIAELKAVFPDPLYVTVDLEASLPPSAIGPIARVADLVILMTYAQHGPGNAPGPLSALPWFDSVMTKLGPLIPPSKLLVGLGNYAVDWNRDTGDAAPVADADAYVTARDRRPEPPQRVLDFDQRQLNPTFVYRDAAGQAHEVWLLDAVTAYNQLLLARRHGAAGAALWVLGAEDPSLWRLYDRGLKGELPSPSALDTIVPPPGISFTGDGEILTISSAPDSGRRAMEIDTTAGLIVDESFSRYPAPYVIRREGYQPKKLALTFDDGPDDVWTPALLDTLERLDVPATFFLIGQNVERFPNVVRRIVADGHEIGNHTFTHPDMGKMGRRRQTLELNACQRAIEAITGRSTLLYRIPYNTDAEPTTAGEATPMTIAAALGYETVGMLIDPRDWNLVTQDTITGGTRPRTAKDIVDDLVRQADSTRGNMVLLHSAGGDRSRTLAAVAMAVPLLQAKGYEFVTVSALMNRTRDQVMPPVTSRDLVLVGFDRVTFIVLDLVENGLSIGFIAALWLAIARVFIVVPLALVARRRGRRQVFDPAFQPPVSVLVAAFNEATVIVRTVRAILDSDYPDLEVVVVDDGSTDGTGAVVEGAFAAEPRVRLLRQANQGKSGALNRGITEARHDILVCCDADTQVAKDAIRLLARHFADRQVAAVAGNVKVGNRINTLTIWQSIEYITSQNLDRRAYAMLNAVTVVPGAIGAWRREAVLAVGGYINDTLAEDMDLTWRLRRAGWRITADPAPVGWTEAPEEFEPFLKQRYRWAYGSLQVLWKHRGALLRYGWFGRLVLPTQWLFQVALQILGPIVDLRLLYAAGAVVASAIATRGLGSDFNPLPALLHLLTLTGFYYALFFAVELVGAIVAFRLDREDMKQIWWLFWQRFVYRQTMYYVLWKALFGAFKGKRHGWGKLQRTGSVQLAEFKT